MSRTPARSPRQAKTPQQRIQEQLGVTERAVKKLVDKTATLRAGLAEADHELDLARQRLAWLRKHPDLKPPDDTTDSSSTSTPKETTNA